MTWVVAVPMSTTLFALVSVFDKRLVAVLVPSAESFNVAFGLLQVPIAALFYAFAWGPVRDLWRKAR